MCLYKLCQKYIVVPAGFVKLQSLIAHSVHITKFNNIAAVDILSY